MKVAAWQYPIEAMASMAAWRAKLAAGVASANAELLVVPEYASMELTSLFPATTLAEQLDALQTILVEYDAAYVELAREHRMTIVAGSFPVRGADGLVRNRALVCTPSGDAIPVEKLQMTRFERETWMISPGAGQCVIDLGAIKLGVAICYDSEFPLIARRLAVAGANVIAVPSCTETLAGYYRVRVASQARALENQCYVIHAPTVGTAPWSIAVDANVGAAAVYAPSDRGFPPDGIVAIGTLNAAEIISTDLDLSLVDAARADGVVLGHRDWELPGHLVGTVTRH